MVLRGLKTINNKQELIVLKIDNNLDKQQSDNEQDGHKDGDESSQQEIGRAHVWTPVTR